MKILHCADLHLGKTLGGYSLIHEQRHALNRIVEIARHRAAEALIVAGDVYDRAVPPAEAMTLYSEFLQAVIQDLGIPVVAIAGNHDSGERIETYAPLLASSGYHVSGEVQPGAGVRIVTLRSSNSEVQCALMPFMGAGAARVIYGNPSILSQHDVHRAMVDDALARMRSDIPRIAVAHCFAQGGEVSDSERVLSVGGLDTVGVAIFEPFAYTALGHLHKAQSFAGGTVRYSGSPIKYSVSEAGHRKSVTLVEINSAGVQCEEVAIEPLRDVRVVDAEIVDGVFKVLGEPGNTDDFVHVRLSNTLPVANALQRIRATFPMALSLEWTSHGGTGTSSELAIRRSQEAVNRLRSMHPLDVFSEFYSSLTGEEPTPEQRALLQEAIERSAKEEQR